MRFSIKIDQQLIPLQEREGVVRRNSNAESDRAEYLVFGPGVRSIQRFRVRFMEAIGKALREHRFVAV